MKTPRDIETMAQSDFNHWLDKRLERQTRAPGRLERIREGAATRCRLLTLALFCFVAYATWLLIPLVAELVGAYRQ